MAGEREIQEAVEKLSGTKGLDTVTVVECTVESVDVSARTCDCRTISGVPVSGVRLMAEVDDGVLVLPVVDSVIIVMYTKSITPFVCQFSSIDRVLVITGDTTVEIKDGLIQFNDGSHDGLVKVADLVTKLNTLERDLNTLKAAFSSWVVVPSDGGAALKAAAGAWYGSTITETVQNDLENTKVTHGI
jgi:hypothetical protein